jgi:EpsD family peptidyl-prolyl cis-trans isomerase
MRRAPKGAGATEEGGMMPNVSAFRGAAWATAVLCGAVSLLLIGGCSKRNAGNEGAPAGQVIAHIGTDDVTIQELENEFRWANVPPDKRDDAVVKRMLGELIVRKYMVQQALAAKLDREPTLHLDVMRSREQVLAGAIMQRNLMAKSGAIGKTEIDKYITAHPSHFANREILDIDQVALPIAANIQSIIDATKDFKSLDQVDQKLTEMGVLHSRSKGVLDSANISDEFLASLQAKKSEDIFFVRAGSNGTFFKVTGEQSKPLTGEEAANRARQALRGELLRVEGGQVAQAANTAAKYEGDYARIMGNQPSGKENPPAKN